MQTVHLRVNDAATGRPTPVRLRLTGPDGTYFAPFGRLTEFATGRNQDVGGNLLLGARAHAYIDGGCEAGLPDGPVTVEISKGFEYAPRRQEVLVKPGQLSLRLAVERFADLRREGWYGGDARCHFLAPHAALLEAAAEDLAVVNLLAVGCPVVVRPGKYYPSVPNLLAFSGQAPALEAPGHLVVVNTLNTHPELGSLALLNCHRVVYPLTFGGPAGEDDWSLADWCDQCHRKGGLVVWARTWHEGRDFALGEPLADLILGKVDAFEIDYYEDSPFDVLADWYALLACGFRVPLVGASGKDSNGAALGAVRTYARLRDGDEFSYKNWVEAVRAGRTFATNGPLISCTAGGQGPGSVIDLPSGTTAARVRAEARSAVPFDILEVVVNGAVAATALASGSPSAAALDAEVSVGEGGWVAARCRGRQQLFHRPANQRVFAHTSPVYLRREGHEPRADAAAAARLAEHLGHMLDWVKTRARCATERQREHLAEIFLSAREELARRAAR